MNQGRRPDGYPRSPSGPSTLSPGPRPIEFSLPRHPSGQSNLESVESDFDRGSDDASPSSWGRSNSHITIGPELERRASLRPPLIGRHTQRGESTRSITDALRLARSREEQETLLGEHELADDDGCYPPRKNDDPKAPNPHASLPVYTTIHRVRRLVIASIGMALYTLLHCIYKKANCRFIRRSIQS